jgi:hypothetical protein
VGHEVKIAIDYDQTITLDYPFWADFINRTVDAGHDIRICTMRSEAMKDEWLKVVEETIPVLCTNRQQKREFCDNLGWHPDIWIDDSPEFIVRRDVETYLKAIDEIN